MRIVVGLGGNALLRRGQPADHMVQRANAHAAMAGLAAVAQEHDLLVVHGNGPQVGLLALESADDPRLSGPYPLDVLVAETQGMIGFWLATGLRSALPRREVAVVLTHTVVDPADPAFAQPTKFIGPLYDHDNAAALAAERGWVLRVDGHRWRRVVPSPDPVSIVEVPTLRQLLDTGTVVIAAGGGGIPIVGGADPHGVDAVVDKDLTAALLATAVGADVLLLLTDVPAIMRNFGGSNPVPITDATVAELATLGLPDGSMGPKVEACHRFLTSGGRLAAIGALGQADAVLAGQAGTRVRPARATTLHSGPPGR